MTYKETKEWLEQAWRAEEEANIILMQYNLAKERAESITAQLSGMPGTTSKDPHKFDEVANLGIKAYEGIRRAERTKEDIRSEILKINDRKTREAMLLFYIPKPNGRHMTQDNIASYMHYSCRHVQRLLDSGVNSVMMSLNVVLHL